MPPSAQPNPLSTLTRLSRTIYLLDPPASSVPAPPSSPSTILLCTWMDAAPRHIAKYIAAYTTLYPRARLLLVTCSSKDWMYTYRAAAGARLLEPAIEALLADSDWNVDNEEREGKGILCHSWSNGGALKLVGVASGYRARTGRVLPVRALVLDSSPGRASYARTVAAFTVGLPKAQVLRLIALFFTHILVTLWFGVGWIWRKLVPGHKDPIERLRDSLNDTRLVPREARRCYVYSEKDEMVWWEDVEDHAREAKGRGYTVELEKFEGSDHAGHARVDEKRYWGAVKRTWEAGEGKS